MGNINRMEFLGSSDDDTIDWKSLPSGVSSSVARKAYRHFEKDAEFPYSVSAMREAIEIADWMRSRGDVRELVSVDKQDLRRLLDGIEDHWNSEIEKGRKRWNEESLMATWIISLRFALSVPTKSDVEISDLAVDMALSDWRDHEFDEMRDKERMRSALTAAFSTTLTA